MIQALSLGIDTSNYKTSLALTDKDGNIIKNTQKYLSVKKGERGLRQSVALFQHVNNLPNLFEEVFSDIQDYRIECIAVSSKPRNVEGSYMPVFNAGVSAGKSLAQVLKVPYYEFSHQDGHIEAVRHYSSFRDKNRFVSFHFSGGTTEAVLYDDGNLSIIGGTRDIAFGQVLDRVGVALGLEFPCGEELDKLASSGDIIPNVIPAVKCREGYINLSGIETFCQRNLDKYSSADFSRMIFDRSAEAICNMVKQLSDKYHTDDFLFAGGVSSSSYIRNYTKIKLADYNIEFGKPELSTDNAVGISLLGGMQLWR